MSERDDNLDDLAARAQQGDMDALGVLWSLCETAVRVIVTTECRAAGKPQLIDDAFGYAIQKFVFEVVPKWNPSRGPFEPFMKTRIRSRVRTWLRRGGLRDIAGSGIEPFDPPEPIPDDDDRALVEAYLRRFDDMTARNKWVVLRLLRSRGILLRRTSDALALTLVDPADPAVEAVRSAWEAIAARWARIPLSLDPPPVPRSWGECVDLFCLGAIDGDVPGPPSVDQLRDPTTRDRELDQWYERVKRWHTRVQVSLR